MSPISDWAVPKPDFDNPPFLSIRPLHESTLPGDLPLYEFYPYAWGEKVTS